MDAAPPAAARAPDISSMSPREQAQRLYDRVMRLASENKRDSAAFFAPMALAAFENLAPFDNDVRYEYGQVAEATGNLPLAGEQADALLQANPDHLLGLILKARVSNASGDLTAGRTLLERAASRRSAELAKALPEYAIHQRDIDDALSPRSSR
jgi:tetratricopeptide (TPR) repeat protein